jgi:hypothetical protein
MRRRPRPRRSARTAWGGPPFDLSSEEPTPRYADSKAELSNTIKSRNTVLPARPTSRSLLLLSSFSDSSVNSFRIACRGHSTIGSGG